MTLGFNVLLLRLTYWQSHCCCFVFLNILKDCGAVNYTVKQSMKNCLTPDHGGTTILWNSGTSHQTTQWNIPNDMNLHSVISNSQNWVFMWYCHPFSLVFLQVLSMDLRFCISSWDGYTILNINSSKQLYQKQVRILNLHKICIIITWNFVSLSTNEPAMHHVFF